MKSLIKVLSAGMIGGIVGAIALRCLLERGAIVGAIALRCLLERGAIDADGLLAHLINFFSSDDSWEDEVYRNNDTNGTDEEEYITLEQEQETST